MDDSRIEPDPSGMASKPECADSLKELYLFLDGELTGDRRAHITSHLDGCVGCYEAYDFEAELRMVVSSKCREQVPDQLRARVADALRRVDEGPPA